MPMDIEEIPNDGKYGIENGNLTFDMKSVRITRIE